MTNLTERWKKGELSIDKSYYLRLKDGSEEIQMYVGGFLCNENNPVDEVLAEVPSYEEWERVLHYAGKYEHEYTSCAMDYENLKEENTKLKELLKGAKEIIEWYKADCGYKDTPTEVTLQHINRLLGEE